jgi:hypothetical protein
MRQVSIRHIFREDKMSSAPFIPTNAPVVDLYLILSLLPSFFPRSYRGGVQLVSLTPTRATFCILVSA